MMSVMRSVSFFFLCFVVLAAVPASAEKLRVVTSIPPVRYFIEKIGGDAVQVESMVPAGADPHSYEPKPKQMAALSKAAAYFAVGLEFEEVWLPKFKGVAKNMQVVPLDAAVVKLPMAAHHHHEEEHGDHDGHEGHGDHHEHDAHHDHGKHDEHGTHGEHKEHDDHEKHDDHHDAHAAEDDHHDHGHHHDHGDLDPHFWLSPPAMRLAAVHIMSELSELDPAHKAQYRKNFLVFAREISALDRDLALIFGNEVDRNAFMVYHPSWGYFARDYGLKQIPIEIEGKEPKPAQLAKLIEHAKEHGIQVIFVQPQFSRKSAKVLAESIGGTVMSVDPLAYDWAENMRKTATAFKKALQQ